MIASFRDEETEKVFSGHVSRKLPADIQATARRKLLVLNAAADVSDLREPPGNRLEKLSGNREGQWSIRINEQWRVCFVWRGGNAYEAEIVDYH